MVYCSKCGAQIPNGVPHCPACGNQVQNQSYNAVYAPQHQAGASADNSKLWAILSYIWILCLIPIIMGEHKKSEFVRFHANQGLILLIASVACGVVTGIISAILGLIPFAGWILASAIGGIVGLAGLILMILGIINAANDKMEKLPVIGQFTILN